jgi:hypothetical protein
MSEIRALLSAAQQAEIRGDVAEAARLLRSAAGYYRERQLMSRALQMLRHARRVEGLPPDEALEETPPSAPGDELGFGDSLLPEASPRTPAVELRGLVEARGPQRGDPSVDAWCSFCCRPGSEVGLLIAGPAGAFICGACVEACRALQGGDGAGPAPVADVSPAAPPHALPAQAEARSRLERARPRLALVIGPEGAGKSALLRALGRPVTPPLARLEGELALVDLAAPLSAVDEGALLQWLDEHPRRRAVLAVRGPVPQPVLVLQGEQGAEPVFDTAALAEVVTQLSPAGLARVDGVLPLASPDRPALEALARALLEARGVALPEDALAQVVEVAQRAGRGAHELAAVIARIPPGRYRG